MAKIYLEIDEVFEHFHRESSYTTLLEGNAVYEVNGHILQLELNRPIYTPAMESHTLKNVGTAVCILDCGHGNGN